MTEDIGLKHCCAHMNGFAEGFETEDLIEYNPNERFYSFFLLENGKYHGFRQRFWFCPWCGQKLPEPLDDVLEEILEKEYGITSSNWNDEEVLSKIPVEFQTDEWWKKRDL